MIRSSRSVFLNVNFFYFIIYQSFKKSANEKDDFGKALISGCFAFGKTPAILLLSPRRPSGGEGCTYQLFNKLTKTYLD